MEAQFKLQQARKIAAHHLANSSPVGTVGSYNPNAAQQQQQQQVVLENNKIKATLYANCWSAKGQVKLEMPKMIKLGGDDDDDEREQVVIPIQFMNSVCKFTPLKYKFSPVLFDLIVITHK